MISQSCIPTNLNRRKLEIHGFSCKYISHLFSHTSQTGLILRKLDQNDVFKPISVIYGGMHYAATEVCRPTNAC